MLLPRQVVMKVVKMIVDCGKFWI